MTVESILTPIDKPVARNPLVDEYVVTWLAPVDDLPANVRFSSGNLWRHDYGIEGVARIISVVATRLAAGKLRMHLLFAMQVELKPLFETLSKLPNVDCEWAGRVGL